MFCQLKHHKNINFRFFLEEMIKCKKFFSEKKSDIKYINIFIHIFVLFKIKKNENNFNFEMSNF